MQNFPTFYFLHLGIVIMILANFVDLPAFKIIKFLKPYYFQYVKSSDRSATCDQLAAHFIDLGPEL